MGAISLIGAKASWNPFTGCTKHSDGCMNCYAERMARGFQRQGLKGYENGFALTLKPERLNLPLSWKKPRKVFVNSMGDIFHEDMPFDFIKQIFDVMMQADQHVFQLLTKRSERMLELAGELSWAPHIMMGVTIESDKYRYRLDHLKQVPAEMKMISMEPLLGSFQRMDFKGIDWIVAGGETGPHARPMNEDWVRDIRDWCKEDGVAFFYDKGTPGSECMLDGIKYDAYPTVKRHDLFG